jgi:soluble lytic murein transglycosylase
MIRLPRSTSPGRSVSRHKRSLLAALAWLVAGGLFAGSFAAEATSRLPKPRPAGPQAASEPADTAAPGDAGDVSADTAEAAPPAAESTPAEDQTASEAGGNETPAAAPEGATPEAAAADSGDTAPLPRPRPELTDAQVAKLLALDFYGFEPDFTLKATLDAVEDGRYAEAQQAADENPDPRVARLVDWMVARAPDSGMSAAYIIKVLKSHAGWPEPEKLQLRAEQAFHALGEQGDPVLTFYSRTEPLTVGGKLSLADALRRAGQADQAARIVRQVWRNQRLSTAQAATVLARFGSMLTRDDQLFRFRRLVLDRRTSEAVAQAQVLGPGYDDLARATIAVLGRAKNASALLRGVAPKFFADPLYTFGRARLLRLSGQPIEAARLILETHPDRALQGSGDVWWDERRDLSRMLLDRGTPDLAYRIVADARPEGESERVEAAFHAGWYALRFLHDPARAEPHFRLLHTLATLPRSQSRASYWLGRTHEVWGRKAAARLDYLEATRFGDTFYGQLSRQRLAMTTTGMERTPEPSALDRIRFAGRELVRVIRLLAASGHTELAYPFFVTLGEAVDTPGEVTLLMSLARRIGKTGAGVRAAAIAEERGVKVASLPAPFVGIPSELRTPDSVDRALVYAVARQESAFNFGAVSHVGARGLMQLMPATARATARRIRLPFSVERLTTDPLYNATIGAHHLGELLDGLGDSYVLTLVGYNAGPGRALQWIRAYGDPRDGADAVDWIERIPFDETRDYVQKVMENLQLYRSRTGHPLSLKEDLVRGGP